jgi:hypothetical protein
MVVETSTAYQSSARIDWNVWLSGRHSWSRGEVHCLGLAFYAGMNLAGLARMIHHVAGYIVMTS